MMWPLRRRPPAAEDVQQAMILVRAQQVANQLVLVTDEMKELVIALSVPPPSEDPR